MDADSTGGGKEVDHDIEKELENILGAQYMITLQRGPGRDDPPYAVCGCGEFQTEPDTNLLALGRAAKEHSIESGHLLRPHNVER